MKQPDWITVAVSAGVAGLVSAGVILAAPRGDVRDYLLDHPEVIDEAGQRLQDRATGKVIAANQAAIFTPVGNAWAGSADPDLTIVEYFDYNCVYCRASLPVIRQLLADDPKLRLVYRELPILSPESDAAAKMSYAAALQGKFPAFHDALYGKGPLSDATITAAARGAGVDLAWAKSVAPQAEAAIGRNLELATRQLGVAGTPGWVIGDRVVSGALSLDKLEEAVAAARAR